MVIFRLSEIQVIVVVAFVAILVRSFVCLFVSSKIQLLSQSPSIILI